MSSQNEYSEHGVTGSTTPAGTGKSNTALSSRFQQMFPVLSATEIDRIRRFGEVERFPDGELLFQAGKLVAGMYVILPGRVAITPRDGLGTGVPVTKFTELIGAYLK